MLPQVARQKAIEFMLVNHSQYYFDHDVGIEHVSSEMNIENVRDKEDAHLSHGVEMPLELRNAMIERGSHWIVPFYLHKKTTDDSLLNPRYVIVREFDGRVTLADEH